MTLLAALSAMALDSNLSGAAPPAVLVHSTLRASLAFVSRGSLVGSISPRVAALTKGVLQEMYWHKMTMVSLVLLSLVLAGSGIGLLASSMRDEQAGPGLGVQPQPKAKSTEDPKQVRDARVRSIENLQAIALAIRKYEAATGWLPPPAIYGKNGTPLLSWRVILLPYLNEAALYQQFHQNEPWDSAQQNCWPRCRKCTASLMLATSRPFTRCSLVRAPCSNGKTGNAGDLVGLLPGQKNMAMGFPGASLDGRERGVRIADITDGTSNTILAIEALMPAPWTKPEDLAYVDTGKLPGLGGAFKDATHAVFLDGKVRCLYRGIPEATLRAAITRNGGEPMDADALGYPAPTATPAVLKEQNGKLIQRLGGPNRRACNNNF